MQNETEKEYLTQECSSCESFLELAVEKDNVELVKLLLELQVFNVNENLIFLAIKNGSSKCLSFWLNNALEWNFNLNATDSNGRTMWHIACKYGNFEQIRTLLTHSVMKNFDFNARDNDGRTGVIYLERIYYFDDQDNYFGSEIKTCKNLQIIIDFAEEKGIDFNIPNNDGLTLRDIAAARGHTSIVKILSDFELNQNWRQIM